MTPPDTAGLDTLLAESVFGGVDGDVRNAQWSPLPRPSPPSGRPSYLLSSPPLAASNRHRRALSDSTVQEVHATHEPEAGAFKIVISKAKDENRPRTTEDVDPNALPHLDINIPSWRIGVPKFSGTGTPLLRGSSYAPSEAMSGISALDRSQHGQVASPLLLSRRPSTLQVPHTGLSGPAQPRSPAMPRSPAKLSPSQQTRIVRSTFMSTRIVIEPAMFDDLTFQPACDDRLIVRYAPSSRAVTAATPPRLVAEITSPNFLDYELISDFFLTFRAFLDPLELLRMLVARLRWAVKRQDQIGMIVHVRTFVALRHWILNYFVDDFVADQALRVAFCNLINGFVEELAENRRSHQVHLKTIKELKKCWRRICDHYWDASDVEDLSAPVLPGGVTGHRNTYQQRDSKPPQIGDDITHLRNGQGESSFSADVQRAGHIRESTMGTIQPMAPDNASKKMSRMNTASPMSMSSLDVVSCSFPTKNMRSLPPDLAHPLSAHPVSSTSVHNQTGPVATTPKTLVGKRVRARTNDERKTRQSNSTGQRSPDKASFKDQEFPMFAPYAGGLVRGNVLPPTQPFVDVTERRPGGSNQRLTTVFQGQKRPPSQQASNAMSSHGMKRLIGSVRRAWNNRGQGLQPPKGNLVSLTAIGPDGVDAGNDTVPAFALVPLRYSIHGGPRPPVRVDLLGAEVAQDFKRVVREGGSVDADRHSQAMKESETSPRQQEAEALAAHTGLVMFEGFGQRQPTRPVSDTGLTGGSKSIVIVDDTVPEHAFNTQHGFSTTNPSVEAFADSFLSNGANPTPPTTPPAVPTGDINRQSSQLFNEHLEAYNQPQEESLPPFVPDLSSIGRASDESVRPLTAATTTTVTRRHSRAPPVSVGLSRMHQRSRSGRAQQSLNSILHRRHASFSSDVAPSTILSFDATTCTRASVADEHEDAVPGPLRVLRKRPGGDLKAVSNVGDLHRLPLRRSQSAGSLSVYTESFRDSYFPGPRQSSSADLRDLYQHQSQAFSVGQLADKPSKREVSLCSSTHSKPIMRPSFEAEAKKLAQIPDEDDDGVEAALAKLEGTFERRSTQLSMGVHTAQQSPISPSPQPALGYFDMRDERVDTATVDASAPPSQIGNDQFPISMGSFLDIPRRQVLSFLTDTSAESYSPIALLDQGTMGDGKAKPSTDWQDKSVLQDFDQDTASAATELGAEDKKPSDDSQRVSFTSAPKRDTILDDSLLPPADAQSFLGSDLSSELSDEDDGMTTLPNGPGSPSSSHIPAHPLGEQDTASPATGRDQQVVQSAVSTAKPPVFSSHMRAFSSDSRHQKPLPPTPQLTPGGEHQLPIGEDYTGAGNAHSSSHTAAVGPSTTYSVHLPFVLAFESITLAQQFTLIEKDALNDIDWKDLVEMDWKDAQNNNVRSWVEFLRNADVHGVEVVIARFNLVVKWAISEVVLTQNTEERAQCIIKYIHIAAHCRLYRNFATMAQLTMALSSNEVSRLAKTWDLVPHADMSTLKELELLVTPMRNFSTLRAEMEAGPDAGCIPFVGIYTHDLLYNAQRPSEIASSPTLPPLVNFERCRIGAGVIKTLLRLIEASTHYDFQPIEGITERCLWLSALGDEEIRRHSGNLE